MSVRVGLPLLLLSLSLSSIARADEIVIDFEGATIGKPVPSYTEKDVLFSLAGPLVQSKAVGRIMFFPHLTSQHKGILNAMATEQSVPVLAKFPRTASAVSVVLWGSTGCPALLEALDANGAVVDHASLAAVPGRRKPADPVPFATLSVKAPAIAAIRISGPRNGEFLAADEIRITVADAN
jgi:hypothetical protein